MYECDLSWPRMHLTAGHRTGRPAAVLGACFVRCRLAPLLHPGEQLISNTCGDIVCLVFIDMKDEQ